MRLLALWLLLACAAWAQQPRNVLLIIADDQGLDPLPMPTLEALAAQGTRYTNGFATVSSCSPSRSVILTGLYSHTNGMYGLAHGVHNQHLLDDVVTLPARLKRAGYTTALVGKKHLKPDSAFAFDLELAPEQPGNRDVAFMAHEAGRVFRGTTPFFVVLGYSDPHRAPENFGNTRDWPEVPRERFLPSQVTVPSHLPDLPAVREDLAQYYEASRRLDTGVALLLKELQESGHAGDTLVLYLSDNGRAFPGAKTTLYDTGLHLPLIVRRPGAAPRVSDELVSWIDVTPTVLDWAGLAAADLPGHSLLRPVQREEIFASHSFHEINQYYPMRAIRTRRYKYILNLAHPLPFPVAGDVAESPSWQAILKAGASLGKRTVAAFLQRPEEELYDLENDPDEVRNLAADPAVAGVKADLRRRLDAMRAATHDPWLPGQTSPHGH